MAARLEKLEIPALLKLRDDVERRLASMGQVLTEQLASLGIGAPAKRGRKPGTSKRAHGLAGRKAAAKFRDPKTKTTWSGRGMTPLWLKAYEAEGKSRDQFAINGAAPKGRKRHAKKASRK